MLGTKTRTCTLPARTCMDIPKGIRAITTRKHNAAYLIFNVLELSCSEELSALNKDYIQTKTLQMVLLERR